MRILRCAAPALALVLAACDTPPPPEPPPPGPADAVRAFFGAYCGDFRQADRELLTVELAQALAGAAAIEDASVQAVQESDFPEDKPLLLEGELFSGLYEGFTGFEVGSEERGDGNAVVEVRFRNDNYDVSWVDEVILLEEDGWKIDNIRYLDKKAGLVSLREVLQSFAETAAAEESPKSPKS